MVRRRCRRIVSGGAIEEAIINAMVAAETMEGINGKVARGTMVVRATAFLGSAARKIYQKW